MESSPLFVSDLLCKDLDVFFILCDHAILFAELLGDLALFFSGCWKAEKPID